MKSLETFVYERRPQVCGIDDRADDCTDEVCDRLMRYLPISGKRVHIEPATYIEDYQVMGVNPPPQPTMNQIPNIEEVERVVEEFGRWARTPANPDEEMKPFTELAQDWLRTTLHQQLQKAREEERERIRKIVIEAGRTTEPEWIVQDILEELDHPELDQDNSKPLAGPGSGIIREVKD